MLNPNIDIYKLRQEFAQRGIVAIHNAFGENLVKAAYEAFAGLQWTLEFSDMNITCFASPSTRTTCR